MTLFQDDRTPSSPLSSTNFPLSHQFPLNFTLFFFLSFFSFVYLLHLFCYILLSLLYYMNLVSYRYPLIIILVHFGFNHSKSNIFNFSFPSLSNFLTFKTRVILSYNINNFMCRFFITPLLCDIS